MKRILTTIIVCATLAFASNIEIQDSYARATPPNLINSAAFMTIRNYSSKDIQLVSAKSNISKVVELHNHDMKDGVMKMYQVPSINIESNSKTILKPGGLHIMFIGLYKQLKVDEKVSLTLEFSNGETQTLQVPVKTVMSGMKHHGHKHMKHHGHNH